MKKLLFASISAALGLLMPVLAVMAQEALPADAFASPIALGVKVSGSEISYGDIIDFDTARGAYFASQYADDARIYGVAVERPPLVLTQDPGDLPVARAGSVLVNVTLENGPIAAGDGIVASSIPGKGMRASASSAHILGAALEAFSGTGSTTQIALQGKPIAAGTVMVALNKALGAGSETLAGANGSACPAGSVACSVLAKINAAPLVTLMRYLIAAAVSLGSLYLAFRSFMADAVNGVISVGRNPRAKGAIQAMVFFNAVLAVLIAIAGLGIGLAILFIQL